MENQQHAPGPWEADGQRIYGANGSLVATVAYCRDHETEVANTGLIAAAPDLLCALKNLAGCTGYAVIGTGHLEALYQARAAIARANATGSEA